MKEKQKKHSKANGSIDLQLLNKQVAGIALGTLSKFQVVIEEKRPL